MHRIEQVTEDSLAPWEAGPLPPFDRLCQYLEAFHIIGEDLLFQKAWEKVALYSTVERMSRAEEGWLKHSAHFFAYFSSQNNFESAAAYADEILTEHPWNIEARYYRLQRQVKARLWGQVREDAEVLIKLLKPEGQSENASLISSRLSTSKAWGWLAAQQLAGTVTDERPEWLITPETLPVFLFENQAPSIPVSLHSDGAELLRQLIKSETLDRCHNEAVSRPFLQRCQQEWSHLLWLRVGLERFQTDTLFCLRTLSDHAVHLST